MKIIVLGATGMAGHVIALYFVEKGHTVTAFSKTPFQHCHNIIGDALDKQNLQKIILSGDYDAVINCIGLLNQDAEENKSLAVYLNSYLPHFISDTVKNLKTRLIHMSTDCVFAGNTGPYSENHLRDGSSFYDRTKALGEVEDNKNLTFRNSIIGPDMNFQGIGLFNWFMKQNGTIMGYSNAIWTGVSVITLAKAMEQSLAENTAGIYNLVNNNSISKYSLLVLFNKYFKGESINIIQDKSLTLDKSLVNTRNDFSFEVPTYEKMVIEMKEWVENHRYLYPHYVRN